MKDLTEAQRAELRADLDTLRAELEALLASTEEGVAPVDLDAPIGRLSRIDAIQQQKLAQANRRRSELRLRQVMAAFAAIRDDEYGDCRRCDEPIGYARLKAMPETPVCLKCQEAIEGATMSEHVTDGVRVHVESFYVPERSDPDAEQYFFAYRVRIANEGAQVVQLKTRHWVITDANGRVEEVRGPGVVGQTPILAPGQHFEYTSFCPLPTPVGSMHGSYELVTNEGVSFDATIAPFTLAVPGSLH